MGESNRDNGEDPSILAAEVEVTLYHINKVNTHRSDNITVEEIETVWFWYASTCNSKTSKRGCMSGYIPNNVLKSICIALQKKAGAWECEDRRKLSLMS